MISKAKRYSPLFFLLFMVFIVAKTEGQDTLHLNLEQADNLFIKNNLQLLLQQYSIDSAKAGIITAKLHDNPQLDVSTGFYQPVTKKFFDYSNNNGEVAFQLSQLLKTAGKRNKAIKLAFTGSTITEYQLYDLLRTLRFTLRNDFFNIYYLEKSQAVYTKEISALQKTTGAFEEQVPKGNIALKELLRIKSQLYSLQAELANLQLVINNVQSEFKLLLRAKATVYIVPDQNDNRGPILSASSVPYQTLLDSAYANRYDLKISKTNITLSQQNLSLQKALAVPDVSVNFIYDRLGSFVHDYNGIGAGVAIPIFNRNQGTIKQAEISIKQAETQFNGMQDVVQSEVSNSYVGALNDEKLIRSMDPDFEISFDNLINEVTKSYEKRDISVLEFIDFYDSYKQNVLQINNLQYSHVSQLELLNYNTGTLFFNK
jgi:cobalt-zinc-cadmium efflux system outer membrane protein